MGVEVIQRKLPKERERNGGSSCFLRYWKYAKLDVVIRLQTTGDLKQSVECSERSREN